MPSEPTREDLLAQVAALQQELTRARAPFAREVSGVPRQPNQKTMQGRAVTRDVTEPPDLMLSQIVALQGLIASGVNSAGYGDKRTEFRSLTDLRQILNDMQTQLSGAGRMRQIRMTSPADKGL